jgi:hypothetical protein
MKNIAIRYQITALALGGLVVILGAFVVWSLHFDLPGGELWHWRVIALTLLWLMASVPIGLLILAIGLFVKNGYRSLRWICIVTSLVILSPPVIAYRYFSNLPKPKMTEERTEVIIQEGGVLTSKPLTLKSKTNLEGSSLLSARRKLASPYLELKIVTGPIPYTEPFIVGVYVSTETDNGATSIKDSNYIGRFGESDPTKRRRTIGAGQNDLTFDIMGGSAPLRDFFKLVQPGKPFSVILVPVGRAANDPNFRIPVRMVTLTGTVYSGS